MSTRKILALLLAVVMICSLFVSPALAAEDEGIVAISDTVGPQFTDVDGHWAESAIKRWAEAGIIEGDGDGTVNPGRNLKRAELATILSRLLGLKERAAADTFSDVAADAWYVDAVLKCAKAGIMQGDGTGKANPESPIDRQQAIVMIGRAVGVKPATGSSLNRFDDGDTVASWAEPYMIALTDMGILNGLPTGEGDGAIIAPTVNIDRASTFALLDKAIAQYITAPCTVTVDDANKFVVINSAAEEAGEVTVTGTTAGVVVAVGTTDNVVLKNADVGTVKVDAPVSVTVSKGSSVDDLDANAAAKIDNKGAVTNLNTNADDVVFDGNKPAEVNTAEGVEPAKDSKGNEVTNAPSTSGGSSSNTGSTTTYKYNVSIPSVTGGKVTADVTRTNTADTVVTLTVTPNAQTATSLPYVLKSLTVKNGETPVTVTEDNKFTMDTEGTYTVNAVFEQPITKAVMYVANGTDKTAADMEADGYTPAGDVTDETLQRYPYFFVAMTKGADGYTVSEMKLTANGADVTLPWTPAIWKFASAYVGSEKPEIDPNENPDKLNFTGSAATFVLTFKIDTAEYEFSCDYVKPGVDASTLHTVTFKTKAATETTLVSYKAAKDEKVTAPAAPAIDGYYFTGWDTELTDNQFTVGETDATVTAEYVKITDQKVEVRPAGPAGAEAAFSYKDEYIKAGMTMADSTISINGATLIAYLGNAENATNKAYLEQNVGGTNYVYFGVQVNKVDGATKVTEATKTPDFTGKTALSLGTDSVSGDGTDVLGGQLIKYFPMATDTDPVSFLGTAKPAWNRYYLWTDDAGEVKGVTHLMLNLVTEVPKLDVTFKVGDTVVYTAEKAVEYGATELPEEVKTAAVAEIAKKYSNVTIELDEMANYTVAVTLTTDVEKLITVTTGTTAFGGDFGDKVTPNAIQDITFAEEKNGKGQIVVEGSLYYTEWPEFSSIQNEQAGYYSALSVPAMEGATVKYNEGAAMSLTEEVPPFVTIMGGANAENFTDKGVKLEIDLDGEGPIEPATYVYNFSAVKAVRWDTRNAETGSAELREDDVNVEYAGNYYANFVVKGADSEQIKMSQDHVVAILKETEEGNIVQFAMEKVNEDSQTSWVPVGDNKILIDEHDNDDPHDMGMTLKQGETEAEQVWYFFVKETVEGKETVKCVKVVFTVPAAPAAQTPDQGADTASLSVVETEDVAAPAPVASYKEDDEVPEIPVMD